MVTYTGQVGALEGTPSHHGAKQDLASIARPGKEISCKTAQRTPLGARIRHHTTGLVATSASSRRIKKQ